MPTGTNACSGRVLPCRRRHGTAASFRVLPLHASSLALSLSLMATVMDSEYYHPGVLKLCLVMQQKKKINFIH